MRAAARVFQSANRSDRSLGFDMSTGLWCDSRHKRRGPPSKHTFRPTLESLGVNMNASNSACGPTNEPFRHTPLPPRLRCEFRLGRERYIGRWLVAKRPSTLAEEYCAMHVVAFAQGPAGAARRPREIFSTDRQGRARLHAAGRR